MWQRNGTIWIYNPMPIITIEPCTFPDGQTGWQACCGGRPVPHIQPCDSLGEMMMLTVKYYDDRIDMTTVKERWNW